MAFYAGAILTGAAFGFGFYIGQFLFDSITDMILGGDDE
jgi:hypothetical protein